MLVLFQNLFAPPRDLILLGAALWIGLIFAGKRAKRYKVSASTLSDLVMTLSIAYLISGRIFFVFEHIPAFIQSPISLISININLFDNLGAFVAAVLTGLVYSQRRVLSVWSTLDAMTIFFSCLALGFGLSHLASGAAFGQETDLPWAIYLWGSMRHPTQLYEIGASILIIGLIWIRKPNLKPGSDFLFFVALFSSSRLIIEAFRGDSTLIWGGLRLAQILSWLVLAISLMGLEFLKPMELNPILADRVIRSENTVINASSDKLSRKRRLKKRSHDTKTNSTKSNPKNQRTR
jgi:phosphatidylglycerol---prolipoprotein diacylglyceryl transferase